MYFERDILFLSGSRDMVLNKVKVLLDLRFEEIFLVGAWSLGWIRDRRRGKIN